MPECDQLNYNKVGIDLLFLGSSNQSKYEVYIKKPMYNVKGVAHSNNSMENSALKPLCSVAIFVSSSLLLGVTPLLF